MKTRLASICLTLAILTTNGTRLRAAENDSASPSPTGTNSLDLRKLLSVPQNEMKAVTLRYDADRGNLNRFYNVALSPTRRARIHLFDQDWLNALGKLDTNNLSPEARTEFADLKGKIKLDLDKLGEAAAAQAEVAPFLPFAATIVGLEESRARMETMNAAKTAGLLNELQQQIERVRRATNSLPNPDLAKHAGEFLAGLRGTFTNWFAYYNEYDPLFTWWAADPYKAALQSMGDYAGILKERAAAEPVEEKVKIIASPSPPPLAPFKLNAKESEVPDLRELLAFPQSAMRGVIQRYENDRGGGRGRGGGGGGGEGGGRGGGRTRTKEYYAQWLDGLKQLDFEALNRDGQLDYLLLKRRVEADLRRLELPNTNTASRLRGTAQRDGSDIVGRPIGREGVMTDLYAEMIPYTPEELIALAEKEYVWCEAEMKKASRKMGFGDDWRKAVEKVKTLHVEPGQQPDLIRDLALEAVDYVEKHDLVTVPTIARETWRSGMMSPQRQLINPFFTGGETISISYPTSTMSHEMKVQSMRGNNIHFSHATVFHEIIPGHELQGFMAARYRTERRLFNTSFHVEGWALYWEMLLYDMGFPRSPEDRVGALFWRMHRCARIVFSLNFHLGNWTPEKCIDYLVEKVGHERDNATAEVRRSFAGSYAPLYQAAYMLGGLQLRALHKDLVESGKMTNRAFHDAVLRENSIPIAIIRADLTHQKLTRDYAADWRFYEGLRK